MALAGCPARQGSSAACAGSATSPVGRSLTAATYATNFADGTVQVIVNDPRAPAEPGVGHRRADHTVTITVRVGTEPTGVVFNQRTGTVYVTNFNDGTMSVITN